MLCVPIVGITSAASASTPKITISATPNPLVETGSSQVNAVVQVEALPGFAGDTVNISSIQLTNSCRSVYFYSIADGIPPEGANPISVTLDNDGNATVTVVGNECAPGKDKILADLAVAPYSSATTVLCVDSPASTKHGVWSYPSKEVETGTGGEGGYSDVYAVFYVETKSVYAEATAEIQADELVDRCGGGSEWVTNDGTFTGTTAIAEIDDNGNAAFVFYGVSCASGTSTIIADVEAGLHPTYQGSFKVLSPRPTI
jgi:hypothetical protein